MELTTKLVKQLEDMQTAVVADAAAFLGYPVKYLNDSIKRLTPGLPTMVGEAVTIKVCSSDPNEKGNMEMLWDMFALMAKTDVPKICVIESVKVEDRTGAVCGDGMVRIFKTVGCNGLLSSGAVRDVEGSMGRGFNLFCTGSVAYHDPYLWSCLGEPVNIGGVSIKTGDLIHADSDGCIIVPEQSFDRIAVASRMLMEFEKKVHMIYLREDVSFSDKKAHAGKMIKELENNIKHCAETDY